MPQNGSKVRQSRGLRAFRGVSIADLQHELKKRHKKVGSLLRKRNELASELDRLERQIEHAGGARSGHGTRARVDGRRRPVNDKTLLEVLREVVGTTPMTLPQIEAAVREAGYETTAKPASFKVSVNSTLIFNKKFFKRPSRGMYAAKAGTSKRSSLSRELAGTATPAN